MDDLQNQIYRLEEKVEELERKFDKICYGSEKVAQETQLRDLFSVVKYLLTNSATTVLPSKEQDALWKLEDSL